MTTPYEQITSRVKELRNSAEKADKYEEDFHAQYPDGMTVAQYCNREVPSTSFLAGAASNECALEDLEIMAKALSNIHAIKYGIHVTELGITRYQSASNVAIEALEDAAKVLEGGK